jgi:hypothetical protein
MSTARRGLEALALPLTPARRAFGIVDGTPKGA